jgi:Holliday junction DNA helicase RuvA
LFGFSGKESRQLFRELIKVNGVGPKLAITIMSGIESDDFVRCVHQADTATLVRLPGVGKKTAERLIIEMRDRLKDWQAASASSGSGANNEVPLRPVNHQSEAEAALIALGYKPTEASKAISKIASQGSTSEELIRLALKSMVTK